MEPVIIQLKKFSISGNTPRASVVAGDITSIEECNIQHVTFDGVESQYEFVCVCLRNGTSINVADSYDDVQQRWHDAISLMSGKAFDV